MDTVSNGIHVLRGQVLRAAVMRRVSQRRSSLKNNNSTSTTMTRADYVHQCVQDVVETCTSLDEDGSGMVTNQQ